MSQFNRWAPLGARFFLGAVFFIFGLNGFLGFIPQPELPSAAGSLMGAWAQSGYFLPFVKAVEVVVGLLLLSNRFVPLALVVLAPITLNILLFHVFLAPAATGFAAFLVVAHAYLGWAYRSSFAGVLKGSAAPDRR